MADGHQLRLRPRGTLAASIGGDPVPGLHADGRPAAFFRGADNALWHVWETTKSGYGDRTGPARLGGVMSGDLAVATDARGRLQVFFRGTDGHLWVVRQQDANGAFENPRSIAQYIGGEPVVVADGHGRLDVFFQGSDHAVWHIAQMFGQPAAGYAIQA
ncbi:hypothetical protein AB0K68_35980 [Streptomyces sp. NPDC050698]